MFTCITWNIEGYSRSKFTLFDLIRKYDPDFLFLSEPMLYQCDTHQEIIKMFPEYKHALASDDVFDNELPFLRRKANGGVLVIWKKDLDRFITPLSCPSSSIQPFIFAPPGLCKSLHVGIYLPTSGKDSQFIDQITNLDHCLAMMRIEHPDMPFFIRGDANVNPNNHKRASVFSAFVKKWNLQKTFIGHPTYHHFLGNGRSDSELDVLLHSSVNSERLVEIVCRLDFPAIASLHDVLISTFSLSAVKVAGQDLSLPKAPRVHNNRVKIRWSKEGINSYKNLLSNSLTKLRESWLDPSSPNSMSILLRSTNDLMNECAKSTNKFTDLSCCPKPRTQHRRKFIVWAEKSLFRTHKMLQMSTLMTLSI